MTSSAESALLSEEIKAKLQEVLQLLNQDIGQLVQDAEPIRVILRSLKGTLPESLEEALHPAAYIESHQISVLKAQKRLSDRLHQKQTIKQRDDLKNLVDTTQGKIASLTQSKASMEQSKRDLEAKRDRLLIGTCEPRNCRCGQQTIPTSNGSSATRGRETRKSPPNLSASQEHQSNTRFC